MIDRLKAIGAEPPVVANSPLRKASSAPICSIHHTPLKEGRRGFFCPKKVGDGYCKETS
jgi:hypothetical protein